MHAANIRPLIVLISKLTASSEIHSQSGMEEGVRTGARGLCHIYGSYPVGKCCQYLIFTELNVFFGVGFIKLNFELRAADSHYSFWIPRGVTHLYEKEYRWRIQRKN